MRRLFKLPSSARVTAFVVSLLFAFAAFGRPGININNFGRINDSYYRGAQPKGNDFADLSAFGFHSVVDLTNGDGDANEKAMVQKYGMKYFQIPMTGHIAPTPKQISQFLQIVNDPANQPVYVHCVGGKHRTGVMTAVYRMTQMRWTADQAFKEMKQYKFGLDFLHPEFKSFVYDYYRGLVHNPLTAQQPTAGTNTATGTK